MHQGDLKRGSTHFLRSGGDESTGSCFLCRLPLLPAEPNGEDEDDAGCWGVVEAEDEEGEEDMELLVMFARWAAGCCWW